MPFYRHAEVLSGIDPEVEERVLAVVGQERFEAAVAAFLRDPRKEPVPEPAKDPDP